MSGRVMLKNLQMRPRHQRGRLVQLGRDALEAGKEDQGVLARPGWAIMTSASFV